MGSQLQKPKRPGAEIAIYHTPSWNFEGLAELPSPFSHGWTNGYIPPEIQRQMMLHPKVYQLIHNNLIPGILGNGGRVVPAVHPLHPKFKLAKEIADFCDWALRNMEGSWYHTSRQFIHSTYEGHKLAPKVFREQQTGTYRGYWTLDKLQVWPNHVFSFMRDRAGNIPKVKVRQIDGYKLHDRSDFAVMTFRPENGSPLGNGVLPPAYEPFYSDVQLDPEEMAAVAQFSRPSGVAVAPGIDANGNRPADIPVYNADGSPMIDDDGNEVKRSIEEVMADQLAGWESGCFAVLPGGSTFKLVEAQQSGEMLRFIRDKNARQLASAILGTHQVTESERQVSTNNQGAAEGTVGTAQSDGKWSFEDMVENDIFVDLVRYNFGEAALDFLPIYDLGSMKNGRLISLTNSVTGLVNSSAFDKVQYWYFCLQVGLPLPDYTAGPVVERQTAPAAHGSGGNHGNADE